MQARGKQRAMAQARDKQATQGTSEARGKQGKGQAEQVASKAMGQAKQKGKQSQER